MKIDNLNALRIYIQKNYPLFLTNDLTLYAIVGKIVDYTNNLIDRMSQLESIFEQLKNETNTTLADLQQQIDDYKEKWNTEFLAFTTEINTDLATFKENIQKEYSDFKAEEIAVINNFISEINADLSTFKATIDSSIASYKESIEILLSNKNTEVDTAISNLQTNITTEVNTYLDNLLTSEELKNILESLYATIYTLSYVGQPVPLISYTYGYDNTNNILYYNATKTSAMGTEITINPKGIYLYNSTIYLPVEINGVYQLQELGA